MTGFLFLAHVALRTYHFFSADSFSAEVRYSVSAFVLSLSRMPRPNRSSISTRMTSL